MPVKKRDRGAEWSFDRIHTRNDPWVDVKHMDFGAKGDGVAVDLDAFRAALASLGGKPGTIFVPPGLYNLGDTAENAITLDAPGQRIVGASGWDSATSGGLRRPRAGGASTLVYTGSAAAVKINDGSNANPVEGVGLESFVVDLRGLGRYGVEVGSTAASTNGAWAGGYFQGVSCLRSAANGAGWRFLFCQKVTMVDCHGKDNLGTGILFDYVAESLPTVTGSGSGDFTALGCTFMFNGSHGCHIKDLSNNGRFYRCVFEDNYSADPVRSGDGVRIEPQRDHSFLGFHGCHFETNVYNLYADAGAYDLNLVVTEPEMVEANNTLLGAGDADVNLYLAAGAGTLNVDLQNLYASSTATNHYFGRVSGDVRMRAVNCGSMTNWSFDGNSGSASFWRQTNGLTELTFHVGGSGNRFAFGEYNTGNGCSGIYMGGRAHTWGNAAPTTGTHAQGDVHHHLDPEPGEPSHWICVAAGTPGTWEPH